MATNLGRPAINIPRTVDLREISAIVSSVRERFAALEAAVNGVSAASSSTTSSGTVSTLATQAKAAADSAASLAAQAIALAKVPVGGIHITTDPTDPATALGYGTWAAFATGRVIVGIDPSDPDFNTVEKTGGTKTQTF